MIKLADKEFKQVQRFIYDAAGITLSDAKKTLVCGRLEKRLRALSLDNYAAYLTLLHSGQAPAELQTAIDLLTTNETYFFREQEHFRLLERIAKQAPRERPMRVWSAASSSGEEAYSMAMVLDDLCPHSNWEVLGTDISSRVLERARRAHYTIERARHVSPAYLQRYCLKGTGPQAGTLLIDAPLRRRVNFRQLNLNEPLPPRMGQFDVIFLRNVMIYFNNDTKQQIVRRIVQSLRSGGYLCIGHSETLTGINDELRMTRPSIYLKP